MPSIWHFVRIFSGTPWAVAQAPGATYVLVDETDFVDDEEEDEEVVERVFGGGGLVVVFTPGAS